MKNIEAETHQRIFTNQDLVNFLESVYYLCLIEKFIPDSRMYEYHLNRYYDYLNKFPGQSAVLLWIFYNYPNEVRSLIL